jgi:hypothetical protein
MRVLRVALRVVVLLWLAAAAIALVALGGEYPGSTAAGGGVALRFALPLSLLPWIHLAALDLPPASRSAVAAAEAAALGDAAAFAATVGGMRAGAPPLALALPLLAALLLAGTLALAWGGRRPAARARAAS